MRLFIIIISVIFVFNTSVIQAQSNSFNFGYDHNNSNSSLLDLQNYGHWTASFRYNIKYKGVNIPLRFRVAKPYNVENSRGILDYLLLPSNRFSINPKYKGVQLFLGHQHVRFSSHASMYKSMFGLGVKLSMNGGIIEVHNGKTYTNVNRSLTQERVYLSSDVLAGRMAFEDVERFGMFFHFIKSKQNKTEYEFNKLRPGETNMFGSQLYVKLFKKFKVNAEGSMSYHVDQYRDDYVEGNLIGFIPIQFNAQTGFRVSGGVSLTLGRFQISTNSDYISPLYRSVSNPFQPNDIIDHTLNVGFSMWKNKLNFQSTIGQRNNNLSNTKLGTNKSLLLATSANIRFHKQFSVSMIYNNFDSREVYELDTFSVGVITKTLSVIPRYSFKAFGLKHIILFNWMANDAIFSGVESIIPTNVDVESYGVSYIVRVSKMRFKLRYNKINRNISNTSSITDLSSLSMELPIWKDKLKTIGRFQYYNSDINKILRYRLSLSVKIHKSLAFDIGGSLQDYIGANNKDKPNRAILTTKLNSRF